MRRVILLTILSIVLIASFGCGRSLNLGQSISFSQDVWFTPGRSGDSDYSYMDWERWTVVNVHRAFYEATSWRRVPAGTPFVFVRRTEGYPKIEDRYAPWDQPGLMVDYKGREGFVVVTLPGHIMPGDYPSRGQSVRPASDRDLSQPKS